jgi:hypothetical protein
MFLKVFFSKKTTSIHIFFVYIVNLFDVKLKVAIYVFGNCTREKMEKPEKSKLFFEIFDRVFNCILILMSRLFSEVVGPNPPGHKT